MINFLFIFLLFVDGIMVSIFVNRMFGRNKYMNIKHFAVSLYWLCMYLIIGLLPVVY